MTSAPNVATYGTAITVTGKLTRADTGGAIAGAEVTLQYRANGSAGGYISAASAKTSAAGTVSFTAFKPAFSVQVRLAFATSGSYLGSTSAPKMVLVARKITASAPGSVRHGHSFRITGSVLPASAGKTIYLQLRSGSAWRTIGTATLTGHSTYAFTETAGAKGKLEYRTVMKADTAFTSSASAVGTVTVT